MEIMLTDAFIVEKILFYGLKYIKICCSVLLVSAVNRLIYGFESCEFPCV